MKPVRLSLSPDCSNCLSSFFFCKKKNSECGKRDQAPEYSIDYLSILTILG